MRAGDEPRISRSPFSHFFSVACAKLATRDPKPHQKQSNLQVALVEVQLCRLLQSHKERMLGVTSGYLFLFFGLLLLLLVSSKL